MSKADTLEVKSIAPMSALPTGVRLQEYVILSVIGEGGFGIVYLARDTLLDREVAIKEYLPATLATRMRGLQVGCRVASKQELFKKGLRHFVDEAHILARFHHPGLVAVLRFIEANGTAYMVMPYYRGTTLHDMVRAGYRAKTVKDLFSVLLPVLEGLSQIHSVKCYHLDVSSDNILILEDGAPVLLDFGSARHVQEDKTAPSTVFLKPGFASIEQYSETDNMKVGPWTDIYAVSALAYLLVTGKMPIISVARVLKDQLVPLSDFASPELPARLLAVIEAGLSVEPSRRPQNVASFIDSLTEAVAKEAPKQSLPESDPEAKPSFGALVSGVCREWLAGIREWGAAMRKAVFAALAAMRVRLSRLRKVLLLVRAVWGRVREWGSSARKAVFAVLAAMSAGLLRMFARVASIRVSLVKATGKMLTRAGSGVKTGMARLLNTAVSVVSKAGKAAADAMSAFRNCGGQFFKKVFGKIGKNPCWGLRGAISLLLLVVLSSALIFSGEKASTKTEAAKQPPPLSTVIESEMVLPSPVPEPLPVPELPPVPPHPMAKAPPPSPYPLSELSPNLPPRPPLPAEIQITVSVKPWGDVYLDGIKIGTAPPALNIKASDIKEGSHKIEIRNEGSKPYTGSIVVRRGQRIYLSHVFK